MLLTIASLLTLCSQAFALPLAPVNPSMDDAMTWDDYPHGNSSASYNEGDDQPSRLMISLVVTFLTVLFIALGLLWCCISFVRRRWGSEILSTISSRAVERHLPSSHPLIPAEWKYKPDPRMLVHILDIQILLDAALAATPEPRDTSRLNARLDSLLNRLDSRKVAIVRPKLGKLADEEEEDSEPLESAPTSAGEQSIATPANGQTEVDRRLEALELEPDVRERILDHLRQAGRVIEPSKA